MKYNICTAILLNSRSVGQMMWIVLVMKLMLMNGGGKLI